MPTTNKRYAKISLKRRISFVQDVLERGKSIFQSAKRLNIKLSTAKLILKNFKKSGKLLDKQMKKSTKNGNVLNVEQNVENAIEINNIQIENIDTNRQNENRQYLPINQDLFCQNPSSITTNNVVFYYNWASSALLGFMIVISIIFLITYCQHGLKYSQTQLYKNLSIIWINKAEILFCEKYFLIIFSEIYDIKFTLVMNIDFDNSQSQSLYLVQKNISFALAFGNVKNEVKIYQEGLIFTSKQQLKP